MRAQQIESLDGPAGLRLVELDEPSDAAQVTIDVRAAGVSFPDLLLSRGLYQMKPSLPFRTRGIGLRAGRRRDGLHHAGRVR